MVAIVALPATGTFLETNKLITKGPSQDPSTFALCEEIECYEQSIFSLFNSS